MSPLKAEYPLSGVKCDRDHTSLMDLEMEKPREKESR